MLENELENCGCVDYDKTAQIIAEVDKLSEKLKNEILNTKDEIKITGTAYYVSENGNDDNDGLTINTPIKTTAKINDLELNPGDGVFFKRGELFRGRIMAKAGVTYAAYGEGVKPRLYGFLEDCADPAKWTLAEGTKNIWKFYRDIGDIGVIVFNHGEACSIKKHPSYIDGKFVLRKDRKTPFDLSVHMDKDLCHFSKCDSIMLENTTVPHVTCSACVGPLYLRCDKGNPGEVFDSVELAPYGPIIRVGKNDNVTVDNLCLKYSNCGVSALAPMLKNLTVTNCEIGWMGGCLMCYITKGEKAGNSFRFGNGVDLYGGCDGFTVHHNYIYQAYDAGFTPQYSAGGTADCKLKNVTYSNNLVEYCTYSYEYFIGASGQTTCVRFLNNIVIKDNIMRYAGFGFGEQRHDTFSAAHIKGWDHYNYLDEGFVAENNIFDRSRYMMFHCGAIKAEYLPELKNNIYIQYDEEGSSSFARWGVLGSAENIPYNKDLKTVMTEKGIDPSGGVYFTKRDWLFDLPDYLPIEDRT